MKKFNEEKVKKMSQYEIQSIICKGLAEVCGELAKSSKDNKKNSKDFLQRKRIFKAFAKLYKSNKGLLEQKDMEKEEALKKITKIIKEVKLKNIEVIKCLKPKK